MTAQRLSNKDLGTVKQEGVILGKNDFERDGGSGYQYRKEDELRSLLEKTDSDVKN